MTITGLFGQSPAAILLILLTVGLVAGTARGFAGFGSGLILMPVASALVDPPLAAATFLVTDFMVTLPLLPSAVRRCDWPTVLPTAAIAIIAVPAGAFALVHADPVTVRWGISAATILMLGLLISGWRYRGRPHLAASLGVGAASGFLGGIAQIAGPPIVTYWMSGPFPAATIRANLITFFFFTSIGAFTAYFLNGLFTPAVIPLVAGLAPGYAVSIWIGSRLHGRASERAFRITVYALIAVAALTSLPALDWLLRPAL